MSRLGAWFDARLKIRESLRPLLQHPIPKEIAGPMGWWYVFGSASLTLLLVQFLTGVGLALTYVPAADKAYESLVYLDFQQPLGWFLRALHYYAGSGMFVMVVVHMAQVFLHGSYKYPRELTWVVGVVLLVLTLGMMFTGQILRWDADAYWGVGVGAAMAGRVPWIGPNVVNLLLGGPIIGGDTLSRFFALHVFVIPGLLVVLLALHLWLVLKRGISAPPVPGKVVDPRTYDADYERAINEGVPFFGEAFRKDAFFSAVVVLVVVTVAAVFGPKGPGALPDPSILGANPKPDWPFWWLFALLAMSPPGVEDWLILGLPPLLITMLLLVPFVSNRGERAPSRRPAAVLAVLFIFTALGVLTYLGYQEKWSPIMYAWSADPVPERIVMDSTPVQLQGAAVFQAKQCRNCHALDGRGGRRGPDLTTIGARLTRDQLIDQVSNGTPGGGDMPAYGKQMSPAEMTVLTEFLASLRPRGVAPAQSPVAHP